MYEYCYSNLSAICAKGLYVDEYGLHKNEPVGETLFYMNGFARRNVLT